MVEPEAVPSPEPPSAEELKRAFKAFKKRLKVTRLDEESKLGYGPMTSGAASGVQGITPPNQFRQAVWQELVRKGKLVYVGQGVYELPRS